MPLRVVGEIRNTVCEMPSKYLDLGEVRLMIAIIIDGVADI